MISIEPMIISITCQLKIICGIAKSIKSKFLNNNKAPISIIIRPTIYFGPTLLLSIIPPKSYETKVYNNLLPIKSKSVNGGNNSVSEEIAAFVKCYLVGEFCIFMKVF